MKVGKILIVMIIVALGFQVNAQRATYVHESYNSVRKYIHPLQLSQHQVADWSRLNRDTDIAVNHIQKARGYTDRTRARKIENVYERHDRRLANILTRRQLERFYNMRGRARNIQYNNNYTNSCPSSYSAPRNQRNGNQYGDRAGNRDARYDNDTSYYDGGRKSRS